MPSQTELLESGLGALQQGRFEDAVALLEHACAISGNPQSLETVRSQINLARAYERTREFDKARTICKSLVDHSDPKVKNWAQKALAALSQNSAEIASSTNLQTSSKTATAAPEELKQLLAVSSSALKQKNYAEAIQALEAYSEQIDPQSADYTQAQVWLAKAYKGNQQTEEAIALCNQLKQSSDPMVQTWAQQFLVGLAAVATLQAVAPEVLLQKNVSGAETQTPPQRRLKSIDQLKNFYERHLLKDLQLLERDRKASVQGIIISAIILFIVPWLIGGLLHPIFGFFSGLIAIFLMKAIYSHAERIYVRNFKAMNIVGKIVSGINPDLTHYPFGIPSHTFRSTYRESTLFKHLQEPAYFKEDDGVTGRVGETQLTFGEIWAEAERDRGTASDVASLTMDSDAGFWVSIIGFAVSLLMSSRSSSSLKIGSRTDRERYTLFRGILLVADFNKSFQYKTVVLPDTAERFLGKLGQSLQAWNRTHGELVKLEDPEFEREFAVYSEDQIEARYILSTNLMQRLVQFRKKSGREISVSFVNQSIYMAIAYDRDLFEPNLFACTMNFKPIQNYYENLQLIISIIDELKLNRRVWGKN